MCVEARENLSCSLEKKIIHFSFTPFGKVSTPDSSPQSTQQVVGYKSGSFSQWCELLSLLFMQSSDLIKSFATPIFKIIFCFHLVSRPPLCSQLPHFCLASISTAMWRTFPDPAMLLFPLLEVQSYLYLFVLLFRGLPAQCCKHCLSPQECPFRWERSPGLAGIILDWRQEVFGWCFWWRHFVIQRSGPMSAMELSWHTL